MTKSNLFQKIPPTVASEGVSRAKPLVCRRSYGQARHGGGFGDRQKDSALNWVNRDRRVFAVVVCVSALIDLDAAKTSAFEGGVHLGGFHVFAHLENSTPVRPRAKLVDGNASCNHHIGGLVCRDFLSLNPVLYVLTQNAIANGSSEFCRTVIKEAKSLFDARLSLHFSPIPQSSLHLNTQTKLHAIGAPSFR